MAQSKKPAKSTKPAKPASSAAGKASNKPASKPSMKAPGKPASKSGSGKSARPSRAGRPSKRQRIDMTMPPAVVPPPAPVLPEVTLQIARTLRDLKCTDVLILDVRGHSQLADYLVLASGTSDRQMRTVADEVTRLARQRGEPVVSTSADTRTTWIVIDCFETVVHIFEPTTRAYYDLESMHEGARRLNADGTPVASDAAAASDDPRQVAEGAETGNEARAHADEALARARTRRGRTAE
ncbi:MAG: ribosome silencing factor [Phycisphaerales bacterium]|nr:ribosome silencing factor [Phycisphaerales bacterium]